MEETTPRTPRKQIAATNPGENTPTATPVSGSTLRVDSVYSAWPKYESKQPSTSSSVSPVAPETLEAPTELSASVQTQILTPVSKPKASKSKPKSKQSSTPSSHAIASIVTPPASKRRRVELDARDRDHDRGRDFFRRDRDYDHRDNSPVRQATHLVTHSPALYSFSQSIAFATELSLRLSENEENALKQFDLNMKYGPNIGLSRLQRWERAKQFGLDPPIDIFNILSTSGRQSVKEVRESIWNETF